MAIIARRPQSNFKPAPEGLYQAVCCDVWDPWEEESPFETGKMVDKTRICWQLDLINEDIGKPFEVSNIYTLSLHDKANLTKHLEAWRGRKFTKEEKEGFDLEKLIGANCQIQIIHNTKEGGGETYANVQAIVPIGKSMTKIRVTDEYTRKRDRVAHASGGADPAHGPNSGGSAGAAPETEDLPF